MRLTSPFTLFLVLKSPFYCYFFSILKYSFDYQVDAQIYLWKWNTRIVISDVDGTITRWGYILL